LVEVVEVEQMILEDLVDQGELMVVEQGEVLLQHPPQHLGEVVDIQISQLYCMQLEEEEPVEEIMMHQLYQVVDQEELVVDLVDHLEHQEVEV
jgi:hypothetical protein